MRKLISVLLVLVLCFSLGGCGGKVEEVELEDDVSSIVEDSVDTMVSDATGLDISYADLTIRSSTGVAYDDDVLAAISSDNLSYTFYTQDVLNRGTSSYIYSVILVTNNNAVPVRIEGVFNMVDTEGKVFDTVNSSVKILDSGHIMPQIFKNRIDSNLDNIDVNLTASASTKFANGAGDCLVDYTLKDGKIIGTVTNNNDYVVDFPKLIVLYFNDEVFIDYSFKYLLEDNASLLVGESVEFSFDLPKEMGVNAIGCYVDGYY